MHSLNPKSFIHLANRLNITVQSREFYEPVKSCEPWTILNANHESHDQYLKVYQKFPRYSAVFTTKAPSTIYVDPERDMLYFDPSSSGWSLGDFFYDNTISGLVQLLLCQIRYIAID